MRGYKLLLTVMSGVAASFIASPVMALEMSAPDGWYIEGNVGTGHLSNINYEGSTGNNGLAYNINLGYKFMPYVALEGGYTKYKNNKIVVNSMTVANISHYSYDLALKGILPVVDSGFDLFAKLGAQHMRARATETDVETDFSSSAQVTGPYFGLGGQFNVMSELGIVVQWQRAQGNHDTGTEDFFSVGLAFIAV